jgi:hypothetical protein
MTGMGRPIVSASPPGSSWISSAVHEAPTMIASGWKRSKASWQASLKSPAVSNPRSRAWKVV